MHVVEPHCEMVEIQRVDYRTQDLYTQGTGHGFLDNVLARGKKSW
jgi:hypothetical protein